MKIKWLGHSCFKFTLENGTTIVTDPVDKDSGYDIGKIETDILTISHDHHDHCNLESISNTPITINSVGEHDINGIKIIGIPTWHDEMCGTKRGNNIMFLIEAENLRILHAGDLGQLLDPLTIEAIGKTDILLVPIGGIYTIDYEKALTLMSILKPKVTLPMHYRTPTITFKLCDITPFLNRAADKFSIHRTDKSEFEITAPINADDAVVILDYAK